MLLCSHRRDLQRTQRTSALIVSSKLCSSRYASFINTILIRGGSYRSCLLAK